jgi:GT2 family glycosyltransferase
MIIPIAAINFNGSKDTTELIDSLMKSEEEFDFIVVDNDSPRKDELEIIGNYICEKYSVKKEVLSYRTERISSCEKYVAADNKIFTLIQAKDNYGFSIGTNIGLQYAIDTYPKAKFLTILNNDTIVTPNFMTTIIKKMISYKLGAAMGTILFYGYDKPYIWSIGGPIDFYKGQGIHLHKEEVFKNPEEEYIQRQFISGCFTIFRRQVLDEIGLLDEDYFFSGEEYQYSYDIWHKFKHKIAWIPDSIIYHKSEMGVGNGSSHNIKTLPWQYNAYITKLVFVNKNKGPVFRSLWHIALLSHLDFVIKPKYVKIPQYGIEGFNIMRKWIVKNLNCTRYLKKDFDEFSNAVNTQRK